MTFNVQFQCSNFHLSFIHYSFFLQPPPLSEMLASHINFSGRRL